VTTILAAEGVGEISENLGALFEFRPFLFETSQFFAFNRVGMLYLLSAVIVSGLLLVAFGNPKLVPGRFQLVMESLVGFVRNNIAIDVIGPKGARYTPILTAMFLFIWVNNLYGITPLVNFPTSSRMALPAMLALVTWIVFILAGISEHGPRYFLDSVKPSGVPSYVLPLIIPIEVVSTFIVRPLTLAVRLFANTMAGHIILAIVFISANTFLFDAANGDFLPNGALGGVLGVFLAFAAGPVLVVFELVVASIQAYIFTILTAVYINSSLSHH
jgi:F-type H+-transporting ATPase subunit a